MMGPATALLLTMMPVPAGGFAAHYGLNPAIELAAVKACGVGEVELRDGDGEPELTAVVIRDGATPTPGQLHCAAQASLEYGYTVVAPAGSEEAYGAIYLALMNEWVASGTRAWLAERGLLARLPKYDPDARDQRPFARAIERLCGPAATGALTVWHGALTFSNRLTSRRPTAGGDRAFTCVFNALNAAGVKMGFVGNESSEPEK